MKNMEALDLMVNLTMKNEKDIDEHILTLFALTLSLKPTMIIELGVRTARSTLPFLAACQYTSSRLISVDTQEVHPDFHFPDDWKNRWDFIKKDALVFLEEDFPVFKKLQTSIQKEIGDLIYIDDWHSGDHVKKELELISEYITSKDLIILHDLMYGNSQPHYRSVENPKDKQWDKGGPYKAVSELDLNIWEYVTIPRCHGLTLLRKKSDKILSE